MAGSRRPHVKSRNGCNRCRARHIRCDETLPECMRCRKQEYRCDFLDGPPLALLGQRASRMLLPLTEKASTICERTKEVREIPVTSGTVCDRAGSLREIPENANTSRNRTKELRDILEHEDEEPCCSAGLTRLDKIEASLLAWNGNSDPFDALPIRVCKRTNAVLAFGRDVYNPATFAKVPGFTKMSQRLEVDACWGGIVKRFQSEGSASGVVCFYATAMSVVTGCPNWARVALRAQVKCTSHLRTRLLQAEISDYPDIMTQIVSLCACENMTGQSSAAKAHCNVLRVLFAICANNGTVDTLTLRVSLEFDRNLSARFLIRTSFDVDVWVPHIVSRLFEESMFTVTHLSDRPTQPVDNSIKAGPMLSIISDLRDHYYTVRRISQLGCQLQPLFILGTYLSMRLTYLEGRLINYYVDLTELWKQSEDSCAQAYICLAALFMNHTIVHVPVINGVRLNDGTSNIRKHLQVAVVRAEETSDLVCKKRYRNALLWALFVSASAERLDTTEANVDGWFETRLRVQLLSMGLKKWADVEKIILGFPCVPEVLSQDVAWVEKLMITVYDEDGKLHGGRVVLKWV
jgi:Fungal Zn(2)-Cys(6) binuclear cluster domain